MLKLKLIFPYSKFRNRLNTYEKLLPYEVRNLRQLVHVEYSKFIAKQSDARYPTMKILHDNIQDSDLEFTWSLSTTEMVIKSMGFRYKRAHAVNNAVLIGNAILINSYFCLNVLLKDYIVYLVSNKFLTVIYKKNLMKFVKVCLYSM